MRILERDKEGEKNARRRVSSPIEEHNGKAPDDWQLLSESLERFLTSEHITSLETFPALLPRILTNREMNPYHLLKTFQDPKWANHPKSLEIACALIEFLDINTLGHFLDKVLQQPAWKSHPRRAEILTTLIERVPEGNLDQNNGWLMDEIKHRFLSDPAWMKPMQAVYGKAAARYETLRVPAL